MITYEPFWDYLDWHEISTYTLITKHHVSSSTINRLRHNQPVSTATIDKLCEILKCRSMMLLCMSKRLNRAVCALVEGSTTRRFCRNLRVFHSPDHTADFL